MNHRPLQLIAHFLGAMTCTAGLVCGATLTDPMDAIGSWNVGGGPNSVSRLLVADGGLYTEGSASLALSASYLAPGFAYTDIYQSLPTALDLNGDSFRVDYFVPDTSMTCRWTVGTSGGSYFSAYFNPTVASAWQTITFQAADFGMSPADLATVNFLQLRVIADGLPSFPTDATAHFDNLQIVPEPSSLLLGAGTLAGWSLRRKRMPRPA